MHVGWTILNLILLTGCLAQPQSKKEAKVWFRESQYVHKNEFSVRTININTASQRVQGFANKCLKKKVTQKSVSRGEWGPVRHEMSSKFIPSVISQPRRIALYLQRYSPDLNMINAPKEGQFEFFAEILQAKKGVKVYSARLKETPGASLGLGNIQKDFESWVKGKAKYCPKIR